MPVSRQGQASPARFHVGITPVSRRYHAITGRSTPGSSRFRGAARDVAPVSRRFHAGCAPDSCGCTPVSRRFHVGRAPV
eukprot:3052068-Lingulodinium_polyedra.AAC.1